MRPRLGAAARTDSRALFLLLCHFDPHGAATAYDGVRAIQALSRRRFEVLNLWPMRTNWMELPAGFDLDRYAGVLIHQTASYAVENLNSLAPRLAGWGGLKILAKQDEHRKIAQIDRFIVETGVDLVLTCLAESERPKAYPNALARGVRFLQTFTGYVSDNLVDLPNTPYAARTYDLTYRGSRLPLECGVLGFEKWAIGEDVSRHPAIRGLATDVSSRPEDRVGGAAWLEFLSASRAVLGVESGSNLFDLEGEVERRCAEFRKAHAGENEESRAYFERAFAEILKDYEGNVRYAQISPRHLEAAATRTLQVLYEGDYSGVFLPNAHYLPLKRDLSNLPAIVEAIRDPARVRSITERAHADIIASGRFAYRAFVEAFDGAVDAALGAKTSRPKTSAPRRRRMLVLCANHPEVDPRIGWMSETFAGDFDICQMGFHPDAPPLKGPSVETLAGGTARICLTRSLHGSVWKRLGLWGEPAFSAPQFDWLESCADARDGVLDSLIGAHDATAHGRMAFRRHCRFFIDTNGALLEAALDLGPFDAIVSADLETLLAGAILRRLWGSHLVYDAHEFWPHSDDHFEMWEREFWTRFELSLIDAPSICVTVNERLAQVLSEEYGVKFWSAANAARLAEGPALADVEAARARRRGRSATRFLFQGGFGPGRGIEVLIDAWPDAPSGAELVLRGPDNAFKEHCVDRARRLGVFDRTVFFPPPVSVAELIATSLDADVGLIPYQVTSLNNKYCCPNKLSQYLAAGLPILAHQTEFVGGFVKSREVGRVVYMRDRKALFEAVAFFQRDREALEAAGARARRVFESEFNWDMQSRAFAAEVRNSASAVAGAPETLDFSLMQRNPNLAPAPDSFSGRSGLIRFLRFCWRLLPLRVRLRVVNALRSLGV